MDSLVSTKEVTDIILSLKNNNAPGEEDYTADFYKQFVSLLAAPLTDTFNDILATGSSPPSWNMATVTVIPKKGRDSLDPKSYRPISLLNQDYKIFTALLARRLNKIITYYIGLDQTGFIPSRDIMDNVYKTLDVIHYCKLQDSSSSPILLLDIEKAFDSVEPTYLMTLLDHMDFGPKFKMAIQAIYNQPRA